VIPPKTAARRSGAAALAGALAAALAVGATAHAAAPDLAVTSLSDPPPEQRAGQPVRVREVVRNRGRARAPAAIVRYYLSLDKLRSAGDVKLTGLRRLGALRPSRGSRGSLRVTIPRNTRPGAYRLLACADPRREVTEASERNNCRASRRRVIVSGRDAGTPPGDDRQPDPPPGSPAQPGPVPLPAAVPLIAAGDIAACDETGDEQTAPLLGGLEGTVATLGDNVYPDGTAQQFADCYGPTWGSARARTRPSPGNHEYHTAGASGYFGYFGAAAGDPAQGYYSYDLGTWHIVALNSNDRCLIVACSAGSPQETWLRADLAAHPAACTLAYFHHPLFASSGAAHSSVRPLWDALDDGGADVILSGHAHIYERFAPMAPDGSADPNGIREFVVGTGGKGLHGMTATPAPNSEVRHNETFGVLELRLGVGAYTWTFHPVAGKTFTDEGTQACH
jgi:hypothetical protein